MPTRYATLTTSTLETELEFVTEAGGLDTEVRINEPSTLCWISKEDIAAFTADMQAIIDRYKI